MKKLCLIVKVKKMVISKDQELFKMLKRDFHIHSLHSGHAYGSIYEIIKEAKSKKMALEPEPIGTPFCRSTTEI